MINKAYFQNIMDISTKELSISYKMIFYLELKATERQITRPAVELLSATPGKAFKYCRRASIIESNKYKEISGMYCFNGLLI